MRWFVLIYLKKECAPFTDDSLLIFVVSCKKLQNRRGLDFPIFEFFRIVRFVSRANLCDVII